MEIEEKKFTIITNKNNEMELYLRNFNNEELSITLFNNNVTPSKKYELKCDLEELQKNRFFKIFINIEEIMKEFEDKMKKSIFIEDTNCVIIEINIGLKVINEILLIIEDQEKTYEEVLEEYKKRNEILEKKLIDAENKLKSNEEKEKEKIEDLEKKIKTLENQIEDKNNKLKEKEKKLNNVREKEMIEELENNIKTLQNQLEEKEKQLQEVQNALNFSQQNIQPQQQQIYPQQQIYSQPLNYSQPLYHQSTYPQIPQQQYAPQSQPVYLSQQQFTPQNNPIPHNHPISNGVLTNNQICYICENKGINQSCYSCQICGFDICQSCCNKIYEASQKKIHSHPLFLTKNEIDCQCNLCSENIKGDFSMNCDICNYKYCKNCFFKE